MRQSHIPRPRQETNRTLRVMLLAVAIVVIGTGIRLAVHSIMRIGGGTNRLQLGEEAPEGDVSINLQRVDKYSIQSTDDLLALREKQIEAHPELLARDYKPSRIVFKPIRNDKPWWSESGFYYYGFQNTIASGPPAEAHKIINPFELVSPEFWGLTIWNKVPIVWSQSGLKPEELQGFPFYPHPSSLIYSPRKRQIEVTYNLSSFIDDLQGYISSPHTLSPPYMFGISAYNAHDFGFKFISFDTKNSSGVTAPKGAERISRNGDHLHYTSICKNTEGCNNGTYLIHILAYGIDIKSLPAVAVFNMWIKDPGDPGQPPELTYKIILN